MKMPTPALRSTAAAALLSLPLATAPAFAQQSQDADQQQIPKMDQQQDTAKSSPGAEGAGQNAAKGPGADTLVATVGDAEIDGADVMAALNALPPQMRQQPPEKLVPMALRQVIMRELILQQARDEKLGEDPAVQELSGDASGSGREDAMVRVWIDREMSNVVTDESVQQAYDDAKARGQKDLPPLEDVRPQIERQLQRQAMMDLQQRLWKNGDIVLYDPSGQPIKMSETGGAAQDKSAEDGSGSPAGDMKTETPRERPASDEDTASQSGN